MAGTPRRPARDGDAPEERGEGDPGLTLGTASGLGPAAGATVPPGAVRLRDLAGEAPLPELKMGPERYHLLGPLGAGAMGVVHLAHDQDLKRRIALKITVLRRSKGSVSEAANVAGLSRQALYDLMKRHAIDRSEFES